MINSNELLTEVHTVLVSTDRVTTTELEVDTGSVTVTSSRLQSSSRLSGQSFFQLMLLRLCMLISILSVY